MLGKLLGGRRRSVRWSVIAEGERYVITFGIARSVVTRYRAGRAAAIREVNDADRHLVIFTITSHEAQWQYLDRYHQQGESVFVHGLLLLFYPFLYLF
jgi:hypothetical protein